MARFSVALALLAAFAVAFAQNQQTVDDFQARVPPMGVLLQGAQGMVQAFECEGAMSNILGGCHVLSLSGAVDLTCENQALVEAGSFFCANGATCSAECRLQLDGSSNTTARDLVSTSTSMRLDTHSASLLRAITISPSPCA